MQIVDMKELTLTAEMGISAFSSDRIPLEPYWSTDDKPESKIHSIHAYPARFPGFIPTKAIHYAKEHGSKVDIISDVFCGCGTVALEAKICGVDFWGCDINPVATLIARVKSGSYNYNTLNKYYVHIIKSYDKVKNSSSFTYRNANERLQYWFAEKQYCDLAALLIAIRTIKNRKYRDVFECLFSSILKTTSFWLTKSIKPQKDSDKKPADVMISFQNQYQQFCRVMLTDNYHSQTMIKTENYLTAKKCPKVDMIVTSPPYVTSYEYADLHQLSSLWLGYADDYKVLRKGAIGSMTPDKGEYLKPIEMNQTGIEIVSQMEQNPGIQKHKLDAVSRYFLDMQRTANKCYTMLNPNSYAFFVVGDTEYKGVKVLNSKHLTEALFDAGFSEVRISKRQIHRKNLTPYRDTKGRFSTDCNSRQVYHEEYVIIGRKDGTV